MSNGVDSANVLQAECEAAINDIKSAQPAKSCNAHEPLSRGVIVLLRCQKATLTRDAAEQQASASRWQSLRARASVWAIAALAGAAVLIVGVALGQGPAIANVIKWIIS